MIGASSDRRAVIFGLSAEIRVYGTSRVFQQLVLKGGEFRHELIKTCVECDVPDGGGVFKTVADNPDAIGFATLRPRSHMVRPIAIAANSGEQAYFPEAESIYSGKYPLQRMFYGYVAAPSLDQGGPFAREFVNLLLSDVGQTLVARAGEFASLRRRSESGTRQARLALTRRANFRS